MTFALFPEPTSWWSLADYGAVLKVMRERKPQRVLEFGPGSSTLALIEGGASVIDSCEDNPEWLGVYDERLPRRFPQVRLRPYVFTNPLTVPGVDRERYDLALVDGPRGTDKRPAAIEYCLQRCDAVLAPTEDWRGDGRATVRLIETACRKLAQRYGRTLTIEETGPLSGAFALLC